jgi:hypothetical protein
LRTNALVSVGAVAFVSVSELVGDANNPTRIASYVAVRSDDTAMGEVMNRLNIEPGVRSERWQKGPAVDGVNYGSAGEVAAGCRALSSR